MSSLDHLIAQHQNRVGPSFLVVLAWLAQCDGHIDESEKDLLRQVAESMGMRSQALNVIFQIAKKDHSYELIAACRNLRADVMPEHRKALFELTIAMAMADGVFSVGENHVLRLLAELLSQSGDALKASFRRVTGRALPEPSDVSSSLWWDEKAKKDRDRAHEKRQRGRAQSSQSGKPRSAPASSKRSDALSRLGLKEGATREEIKAAYKRLAKVHHPDQFHGLDEEIIEAASLSFRRIRQAYEYLVS
ncbi:MAG: TerB family tellurite resistance protein [Verrucomicrobiales bacterium]|nr:TerB family tellurite resistance protein [Verrucomicrobiales bacterium]